MKPNAVLMLAYGTPSSLDDMADYLLDVRGGRPPSPELVAEMKHRYELIGKSPLTEITLAQARAVEAELSRRDQPMRVFVGMRHWKPWIKDAVAEMKASGIERAVAIVMAPHYSSMSIGRYQQRLDQVQKDAGSRIQFQFVTSWWEQPCFLQALEDTIRDALTQFPGNSKARTRVIFSAHSLPTRILETGDPYDEQLKANARHLADRLGISDWMFAYQSAGATPEPWLGPALEDVLPDLSAEGYQQVLVAPIGFVCDHVEILYDIDIEAQKIAKENGILLVRAQSMNTKPLFIQAVADAILDATGRVRAEML